MNIVKMMQKASQVKQQMQDMQERVKLVEIEGVAGKNLVTCRMNGRFELLSLKIDPSLINAAESEIMEDMIVVAINDARLKSEKLMSDETKKIMADLGLPAGTELPF